MNSRNTKLIIAFASVACALIWWSIARDGDGDVSIGGSKAIGEGKQSLRTTVRLAEQPTENAALTVKPAASGHRDAEYEQKNHRIGATRTKLSKDGMGRSLGDYLSSGLDEMPADIALEVARMISYCQALPLLGAAQSDDVLKAVNDPQQQKRLRQDRQGLDELGFECQTVPRSLLDGKKELQVRQKLIRRAYDNEVAGAAVEFAKLPSALVDVPESELYSRVNQDAMSGNVESIQLLIESKVLRERINDVTLKVLAFGVQRAVDAEIGDQNLRIAQASMASSLWKEWAAANPNNTHLMYGMPGRNTKSIQYPPNFTEPSSIEYIEKSRSFDAKLKSVHPRRG